MQRNREDSDFLKNYLFIQFTKPGMWHGKTDAHIAEYYRQQCNVLYLFFAPEVIDQITPEQEDKKTTSNFSIFKNLDDESIFRQDNSLQTVLMNFRNNKACFKPLFPDAIFCWN